MIAVSKTIKCLYLLTATILLLSMPSNLYAEDDLPAHLIVQTIPPGAEVFLDEKSVGKSPVAVEVTIGSSYWIEIAGPDGSKFVSKVKIERQMERMLVELGSKKPVKFSPDLPEEGRVYIDGFFMGTSPAFAWLQPGSRHKLIIEPVTQNLPAAKSEIRVPDNQDDGNQSRSKLADKKTETDTLFDDDKDLKRFLYEQNIVRMPGSFLADFIFPAACIFTCFLVFR
jgi:hypothetical protein